MRKYTLKALRVVIERQEGLFSRLPGYRGIGIEPDEHSDAGYAAVVFVEDMDDRSLRSILSTVPSVLTLEMPDAQQITVPLHFEGIGVPHVQG